MVERLDEPDDRGRLVRVTVDLQEDFALNQPLAPFVLAAVELFDRDDPGYALDIVSVVEAMLDDPGVVLAAQLNKAKGELVAELKAAGMEYEERMARLDEVTYPKPLRRRARRRLRHVRRRRSRGSRTTRCRPSRSCATCGSGR